MNKYAHMTMSNKHQVPKQGTPTSRKTYTSIHDTKWYNIGLTLSMAYWIKSMNMPICLSLLLFALRSRTLKTKFLFEHVCF